MLRIAHLADIHIVSKRREEYDLVFTELYKQVEGYDIIVVAGDIFHDKNVASAVQYNEVHKFLSSLANAGKHLVIIPGNHDTDIKAHGVTLLDSVIYNLHLQPPKVQFFRRSGYYEDLMYPGLGWHVVAPDGGESISDRKDLKYIGLFHDEIGKGVLVKDFTGDIAVMGGHVHKQYQIEAPQPMWYCGSLIQQHFGEAVDHGFLEWEFDALTMNLMRITPHIIPNIYAQLTVDLDGPIPTILDTMQWQVNVNSTMLTPEISAKLRAISHIPPARIHFLQSPSLSIFHANSTSSICEVNNNESIVELHKRHQVPNVKPRCKFRLLTLEFYNVLCYERGFIDFTLLEHCISGIDAPNGMGKSTIITCILVALYGKSTSDGRIELKSLVRAQNEKSITTRINFQMEGGDKYEIRRTINPKGHSTCEFTGGTGATLMETNRNIINVIGDIESMITNSFMIQGEMQELLAATPKRRADILINSLGLNNYDSLLATIALKRKDLRAKMEMLKRYLPYSGTSGTSGTAGTAGATSTASIDEMEKQKDELLVKSTEFKVFTGLLIKDQMRIKKYFENDAPIKHELSIDELVCMCEESAEHVKRLKQDTRTLKAEEQILASLVCPHQPSSNLATLNKKLAEIPESIIGGAALIEVLERVVSKDDCACCVSIKELVQNSASSIKRKKKLEEDIINYYKYDQYQAQVEKVTKLKSAIESRTDLTGPIGGYISYTYGVLAEKIINLDKQNSVTVAKISSITKDLTAIKESIAAHLIEQNNRKQIEDYHATKDEYDLYTEYEKAVVSLSERMLSKKLDSLIFKVNSILRDCGNIATIHISDADGERFKITFKNKFTNDKFSGIRYASGAQRVIISIALNLAMWELSEGSVLDALFIDEAITALDGHYLAEVTDFITSLTVRPSIIFIISHIESIKDIIEQKLYIQSTPNGNIIEFRSQSLNETGEAVGEAGEAAGEAGEVAGDACKAIVRVRNVVTPSQDSITCGCGSIILKKSIKAHEKTKKHMAWKL